ncbi:primosomal protein N' [Natranaerobius trueperi]|uniref:Replication restart protein PriA n=1 Tax=Natranaerobius trueperi TaxID=759412 RepID=A0A226BZE1_9FIRM|nr:primosomal protein N' [Natranaerobius trueperi]OWZ84162.1 primosomal protein N' [Natranaerobius trueperi]
MKYCNVIILDIVSDELDRKFTYRVPEKYLDKIIEGVLVKVPFGKRRLLALVVEEVIKIDFPKEKLKDIVGVVFDTPVLTNDLLKLANWMSQYYLCSLSKVVNTMLPKGVKLGINPAYEKYVELTDKEMADSISKKASKQKNVCEILQEENVLKWNELLQKANCTEAPVKSLQEKGVITVNKKRVYREPISYDKVAHYAYKEPTHAQKTVLKLIKDQLHSRDKIPTLLFGVTGSGKTEVYLQVIEEVLKNNKDTIVLIPEISLTPQTIARFVGRFGDKVAVIHSRLSTGERFDQWEKVLRGKAKIVVGPRSAIFAPCKNLGLVIIDEEHENSYKQGEIPRYHVRSVAEKRCEMTDSSLILGSATPSMESIYKVKENKYQLAELSKRATDATLPDITLIDMKSEFQRGNKSIFSKTLLDEIKRNTDLDKQVILFLNRRGYASFLLCRECGYTITCPRCEVTLTYHKFSDRLLCHYCDYTEPVTSHCPSCKSNKIKEFGTGTQKIELELKKYFPYLSTIRMDVDTTSKKNSHKELLDDFKNQKAQVLIGTQMITKGLDIPNVSLVGVITADTALNLPDFRAGEKTFQLLTQVSGRAGRGEGKGHVVIQSYNPSHYSIQAVRGENVRKFAKEELAMRKKLNYPPYSQLIRIVLRSSEENALENYADHLADKLEDQEYEVLGPNPCPILKIKDEYRWHLMVKVKKDKFINDKKLQDFLLEEKHNITEQGIIRISIDVDPINLL